MTKNRLDLPEDESWQQRVEAEIEDKQKISDYDIREYPVEVLVEQFTDKNGNDEADFFIPDYQRELIWDDSRQSRFIESVLINLPIPYIFVAEIKGGENDGRAEIVDGSQRMRTLQRYLNDDLQLRGLKLLPSLNGYRFSNLTAGRQRRFKRKTIRLIELKYNMDEEARREMFDRLNTGGVRLESMEQRMGSNDGPFLTFVKRLAENEKFRILCPVSLVREKHREYEELVLRFFAYLNNYHAFEKRVETFLDEYLASLNSGGFNSAEMEDEFYRMLNFIEHTFQYGFRKNASNKSVPRIRFEALAVGSALALRDKPDLAPIDSSWIFGKEFGYLTRSDASNSRPKVINRIHYVRDMLLEKPPELIGDEGEIFSDKRELDSNNPTLF